MQILLRHTGVELYYEGGVTLGGPEQDINEPVILLNSNPVRSVVYLLVLVLQPGTQNCGRLIAIKDDQSLT